MKAALRYLPWGYAVLCLAALAILIAGLPSIAGDKADPLSGIFAFLLALPWVLLTDAFDAVPLVLAATITVVSMLFNFWLLRYFVRRCQRRPLPDA